MNSLKKTNGFSLIELLVALTILSFSLLALAGLTAKTTSNNSFGSRMTEAATFAQDKLEELKASQWINIHEGLNTDQKVGSTGVNYTRNWNVIKNGSLKTIAVTINWNDRINHSIELTSVFSQ